MLPTRTLSRRGTRARTGGVGRRDAELQGRSSKLFLAPPDALSAPLLRWLVTQREPMVAVYDEWMSAGPHAVTLYGNGDYRGRELSVAVAKPDKPLCHFEAKWEPANLDQWQVGAIVSFVDGTHSTAVTHKKQDGGNVAMLTADGDNAWAWKDIGKAPLTVGAPETLAVDLPAGAGQARVTFNGCTFTAPATHRRAGLTGYGGTHGTFVEVNGRAARVP